MFCVESTTVPFAEYFLYLLAFPVLVFGGWPVKHNLVPAVSKIQSLILLPSNHVKRLTATPLYIRILFLQHRYTSQSFWPSLQKLSFSHFEVSLLWQQSDSAAFAIMKYVSFQHFCIFLNSKSKIDHPREFAMIEFEYVSRKWTKVSKKFNQVCQVNQICMCGQNGEIRGCWLVFLTKVKLIFMSMIPLCKWANI